jgi:hypothetical protein
MPVDQCWCCAGRLAFQTTVQGHQRRRIEPFALGLCLDNGCIEIGYWIAPTFNKIRLDASAWDPLAVPILTVKRAIRTLVFRRDQLDDEDWPVDAVR